MVMVMSLKVCSFRGSCLAHWLKKMEGWTFLRMYSFVSLYSHSLSLSLSHSLIHRIQAGDMLVEVANQNVVGGALDKATELLQQMRESIRLKIGRPDVNSSVFIVQDGEEVNWGINFDNLSLKF